MKSVLNGFRQKQLARFLLLLIAGYPICAESRQNVRFHHLSAEQGLSQSYVYSIAQDDKGFIWLGTQNGLNRFDGHQFTVFRYDPDDETTISGETIRHIHRNQQGKLWIATDSAGLNRFDPLTGNFRRYQPDTAQPGALPGNRVRLTYSDSRGRLLAGLDGGGLSLYQPETDDFRTLALPARHIWNITETLDGCIWLATREGLLRLNPDLTLAAHYHSAASPPFTLPTDQLRSLYTSTTSLLVG
ncbi:MAG: hypothetical protein KDI36_15360, partial [Pseudomonadales bacterium]|nr:hypothetical protein [Pseudomonadales bacterium]